MLSQFLGASMCTYLFGPKNFSFEIKLVERMKQVGLAQFNVSLKEGQ